MAYDQGHDLVAELAGYGPTLVLFSGGVDSAVVLAAAARALGPEQVLAMTAVSPAVPSREVETAAELAAQLGVRHRTVATTELEVEGYRRNGPDRCAFCKSTLVDAARALALLESMEVIATGTNAGDVRAGFRPGIAAAARRGARTPLADLGIAKDDVRAIARVWNLPVWSKPATACLASRIAYDLEVTPERLARVDAAEVDLRAACDRAGISVRDLRVRDLGDGVRVEVEGAVLAQIGAQPWLAQILNDAGFDGPMTVEEFRSGSMNELLPDPATWRFR